MKQKQFRMGFCVSFEKKNKNLLLFTKYKKTFFFDKRTGFSQPCCVDFGCMGIMKYINITLQ